MEADCHNVDEQVKEIQAFDLKLLSVGGTLPSRLLELFQLKAQLAQSVGKLLRHIYTDNTRVSVGHDQVRIANHQTPCIIVLLQVFLTDFPKSRLKCILPSDKNDNQNEVRYFDKSAAMLEWLKA